MARWKLAALFFFFSSRRRHTRSLCDWSSDVCSSDLHSLKDLPTVTPEGLAIAATPEREDPRDALVLRRGAGARADSVKALAEGAVVGTSSLRRIAQLKHLRPDVRIKDLRGNVDTRLRKLDEGDYDALILAAAGLRRLGFGERISAAIEQAEMISAVGQGSLGIETRADDDETNALVSRLDDPRTRAAVVAERALLRSLGGGCQVPIAAHATVEGGRLKLDGPVENLFGYDWLVLTSANAVEHFLARLEAAGKDVSELDELHVCAIGEATGARLVEAHVHVDVVPEKSRAEGVFEALEAYLGGRERFENLNFLLPRAAVARDFLPRALEAAGARCDVVEAYRTVRPETTERARAEALLVGGGVDCVTFTSSSTVHNFAQLFDTRDLGPLLAEIKVACIGDITAGTAAEYGLSADVIPTEATTAALARAVA